MSNNQEGDALARLAEKIKVWREPRTGLQVFARDVLRIVSPGKPPEPLILNDAQLALHEALEDELSERGYARRIILKARRMGISTYVAARFYHRVVLNRSQMVYVLSHERPSTHALFAIVKTFNRYNPFAPEIGEDNITSLSFPKLGGKYTVATAATEEGGRGQSANLMHGSEIGYWPNAKANFASAASMVLLEPGTEIILESTSAGPSGEFYEKWKEVADPNALYKPLFLPWTIDKRYFLAPPDGWRPDGEIVDEADGMTDAQYAEAHSLTPGQAYWRKMQIESAGGRNKFRREFPLTADEAFAAAQTDALIQPAVVMPARLRTTQPTGGLILGVDPAGGGGDRFAVVGRRGDAVTLIQVRKKVAQEEAVAWLKSLMDEHDPVRVNVDMGNIGYYLVRSLLDLGPRYSRVVTGINFGDPSQARRAGASRPGPINRRAEMWGRVRDWLAEEGSRAAFPAAPRDSSMYTQVNDLVSDLSAPGVKWRPNGQDWLLESKEDMRKRGVRSTDLGDALALTFASLEYFRSDAGTETPASGTATPATSTFINTPHSWMGY